MPATNIIDEHHRAFEALTSGRYDNFALFSYEVDNHPAAPIVLVNQSPPPEDGGEPEYVISPLFVSVTPAMRIADHDGRDA